MKFLLLGVLALILVIIVAIPSYLGPDDLRRCKAPEPTGKCAKADAIVAVSGGDTRARTLEAVQLYHAGWAPKLIFSGAAADENSPSNASAMEKIALSAGVPATDVMVEEFSRTTAENALNTSKFIAEQNIEKIVLVTSAYHQRRALLEFSSDLGPSVAILNHPVAEDRQWAGMWWWTRPTGWWLAVSELLKVLAFYGEQGVRSNL